MSSSSKLSDAYVTHRFAVELEGVHVGGFGEVSGLQAQTEVFEYKEGGLNTHVHKLPGRTSYSNVTLKWGSIDDDTLWKWYEDVITSPVIGKLKKAVSIIQFDGEQQELRRWNLRDAYPVKWMGPSFNSATSQVGIETLELAYADFEMVAAKR